MEKSVVQIKDVANISKGDSFRGVMLLGVIRGRVEEPNTVLGKALIPEGTTLWVLDVFGIRDGAQPSLGSTPNKTYFTQGSCVVSYKDVNIEGAIVYVRGAVKSNGSYRDLTLKKKSSGSWQAISWSKSQDTGDWLVMPCTVKPLRDKQISSFEMLQMVYNAANTGNLVYPKNADFYGKMTWNESEEINHDYTQGILPARKGTIAWKRKHQEGYSFVGEEGKGSWVNPETLSSDVNRNSTVASTIPSVLPEGVNKKEAFINGLVPGDRVNPSGVWKTGGFDDIPEGIKSALSSSVDTWRTTLKSNITSVLSDDNTYPQENYMHTLGLIGREWAEEIRSGDPLADATGHNYIRNVTSEQIVKQLKPLLNIYNEGQLDSGRIKTDDVFNGAIDYVALGSLILIMSAGIRLQGHSNILWGEQSSAVYRALRYPIMYTAADVISCSLEAVAGALILKYGQEFGKLLGFPQYYVKVVKTMNGWESQPGDKFAAWERFKQWEEQARDSDFTNDLFQPVQSANAFDAVPMGDNISSSPQWLGDQDKIGCIITLQAPDGQNRYYPTVDCVRSKKLWERLKGIESGKTRFSCPNDNIDRAISEMEAQKGFDLDDSQKRAVHDIASGSLGVLTGVAGSGKTTVLNCIINAIESSNPGISVILAAPTGKAAARMRETTGRDARTLHSTFNIRGTDSSDLRWLMTGEDSIDSPTSEHPSGLYVFDEVSMCGFELMCKVIGNIPRGSKVILVGDKEQLPPVQDIPVFAEILSVCKSGTRLAESHRAAEGSLPTSNAYQILKGRGAQLKEGSTFEVIQASSENIRQATMDAFIKGIKEFGIDGCRVVTPFKSGATAKRLGYASVVLNPILADELQNTGVVKDMAGAPKGDVKASWFSGTVQYVRIGERVMNTMNSNGLDIYSIEGEILEEGEGSLVNGQEGIVMAYFDWRLKDSDSRFGTLIIDFGYENEDKGFHGYYAFEGKKSRAGKDDALMQYGYEVPRLQGDDLKNIEISYAETVHKMQGSEVPCIIIPVSSDCRNMQFLNRALIYTAITRASKKVVLIGDVSNTSSAIARASSRSAEEDTYANMFSMFGSAV